MRFELPLPSVPLSCCRVVFRMNHFALQLLHTYSVNASTDALKPLASDHIYNVFAELQKGKSNTLAAGLAQLLHDWKHMFKCVRALSCVQPWPVLGVKYYATPCHHPGRLIFQQLDQTRPADAYYLSQVARLRVAHVYQLYTAM